MKSVVYNAFLPIRTNLRGDATPDADVGRLEARGIDPEALSVLRHVRDDVLSLVRRLKHLKSFSFLVHDRTSGVPTSAEDASAYVHLRLVFVKDVDAKKLLGDRWAWVSRVEETKEEAQAHEILNPQSAWYLDLVDRYKHLADFDLLMKVRQHFHFFANMAQMRVS